MFVRVSRSLIKPERLEEFKTLFAQQGLTTAKQQPGFRWAFALPPLRPDDAWQTISGWERREDAEAYHQHPDRTRLAQRWLAFYIEPPAISNYDEVIE